MTWRGGELFASLVLFVVLSVVFMYCAPAVSTLYEYPNIEDHGYVFSVDGATSLNHLRFYILGFEQMSVFMVTSGEWLSQIRIIIVLTKDFIAMEDLTVYTLNWLNTCEIQLVCCIVVMYLVYTTYKENVVYSRLVKDLKIVQEEIDHQSWQVDVHEPEIEALTSRLMKNKETRIPDLCKQLEMLYKMIDVLNCQYLKLEEEIAVWKPTIINETNKLQKLNYMLYKKIDSEMITAIRSVGFYAGQRVSKTAEDLHDRIAEIKSVLEETSKLMDIKDKISKSIPMRVEYGEVER